MRNRRLVLLAGGGLYAGLASLTQPMTRTAEIACVAPAALVLALACRSSPRGAAQSAVPVRRTAAAWTTLLAFAAAWELTAWLQQPAYNIPSRDHPTVSVLLDPLTGQGPLRLAAWAAWLWAGWRLVRR